MRWYQMRMMIEQPGGLAEALGSGMRAEATEAAKAPVGVASPPRLLHQASGKLSSNDA
jgi:hypothetical protein